jgi:cytochrome c biogenesis protein CcdA/glutaredoxin
LKKEGSKLKKLLLILILFSLVIPSVISEDSTIDLYLFYGQGCPHCSQAKVFLDDIKGDYSGLNIIEKEIYFNDNNRELFEQMANSYGKQIQGVPTIFINGKMFVGFSNSIKDSLENEIEHCIIESCMSPLEHENTLETLSIETESSPLDNPEKTQLKKTITVPAVLSAAAVDAINPCAFAVLIILLTTILATKNRNRALLAGIAFTISIFISYLLMGIGLYSAINTTGITHWFYSIVALLAILIGLFNLKDYLWYGKWFIMEVPIKWRPRLKSLIKGVTSISGAFLIGFVVSLFLLPCTSGPYIIILGLLAKTATKNFALWLLLLYNFIFILPMVIITLAIYFGFTTTEKAEKWRLEKLKVLHLIAGIILLLLGIGMIIAMGLRIV